MDKATYKSLKTEERISYLNVEMAAGKKLWKICESIGIANNITTEFKKKGYIRNEEGLFIKRDQQPDQTSIMDHPTEPPEEKDQHEQKQVTSAGVLQPIRHGGHSSSKATLEIYSHVLKSKDEQAAELMQEVSGPAVTASVDDLPAKRVGRPPREGEKPKKLTIEIDPAVYKALMHYKVDSGIYVNAYIEDLLKANLPGRYFGST